MKFVMRYASLTIVAIGVGVWLLLTVFVLVSLLPWFPRTPTQWVVVVLLGVPFLAGAEYLGDRLLSPALSSKLSSQRFSWLRLLYLLAAMLVFLAIVLACASVLGVLLR